MGRTQPTPATNQDPGDEAECGDEDRQGGKLLPTSQTVQTFSPMVGLSLPGLGGGEPGAGGSPGRARLLFQYDVNRNNMARDPRGVPTSLASDVWTLRLQGAM